MKTKTSSVRVQPVPPGRRGDLLEAWRIEFNAARAARVRLDDPAQWRHLERAHILSQPMARPHVRTHVAMLAAGLRRRDRREVLGQLGRVVLAAPGSLVGKYPVGNTGVASVSAFEPMPIPDDLQAVLNGSAVSAR